MSITRKAKTPQTDAAHTPAPRDRLLQTAARLFYAEGIRAVGVDRIVAEAQVTKATLYRHFPAKDDLVVAYLEAKDQHFRSFINQMLADGPPDEGLYRFFDAAGEYASRPGFRGCPFMNAATEYPDATHPVRAVVAEHRIWLHGLLEELLRQMKHSSPKSAADVLLMLYDGAMASSYLDNPGAVHSALHGAVASLLSGRS